MNKKFLIASVLMFSGINLAYAGYGIDCVKPTITSANPNMSATFTFTCKNNTPATFSYFNLTATELDRLQPASISLAVTWPHTAGNIRPGDVGVVTGTFVFPTTGNYSFDFTKGYGGETFSGIFCKNGKAGNCVNINVSNPPKPVQTIAYIANDFSTGDNTVSKCNIATNGNLTSCTTAAMGFNNPHEIIINPQKTFAYVLNIISNIISKCGFAPNGSGDLTPCTPTGSNLDFPDGIAIRGGFAYIANQGFSNNVTKCTITANGDLTPCVDSNGSGFAGPARIIINEPYAYITNISGNNVTKCSFNTSGNLINCTNSGTNLSAPVGIAIKGSFAYISNFGANNVTKCSIDSNGNLTSCNIILSATGFSSPESIVINAAGTLAYVANPTSASISKCSFASNGDLTSCTPTGNNLSGPTGIALF